MKAIIIGLAGSLRQGSYNRRLLNACVPLLAPSFTLEIHGLEGIPMAMPKHRAVSRRRSPR
jgi:NAD(P)H-dependent FMN reductase